MIHGINGSIKAIKASFIPTYTPKSVSKILKKA